MSKIMDALSQQFKKAGQQDKANEFALRAFFARSVTLMEQVKSAKEAETAAKKIVNDLKTKWLLSGPCPDEKANSICDVNNIEKIHLIGHSRGGAVNARVSKLLVESGYNVQHVTVLDGFSKDWIDDAGILGDISIAKETSVRDGGRKVNYQVQKGLSEWLVGAIIEWVPHSTLDTLLANNNINVIFRNLIFLIAETLEIDPEFVELNGEKLDLETLDIVSGYNFKAPDRPGFDDNIIINTSGPDEDPNDKDCRGSSQHLNITACYAKSKVLNLGNPNYILDNFVGMSN